MSATLSVRQICERSLREIGSFPIYDTEADPGQLEEASYWLDMLVGHLAGTKPLPWLYQQNVVIALQAAKKDYPLTRGDAEAFPDEGYQFPISTIFEDATGQQTPIRRMYRKEYEEEIDDKDLPGDRVCAVYIDRITPTLTVWPVPTVSGGKIIIPCQSFAPDLVIHQRNGLAAERAHQLRAAWQLWLVTALSHRIGGGPVRKLSDGELNRLAQLAERLGHELLDFEGQEHTSQPRITRPWGL
jgi:hypothetical protein